MIRTHNQPQSIDSKVLARIRGRGMGSVHVPGDFLDLGSREAIDLALHRLAKKGVIRRLARGVYDFPKHHPTLGLLSPSANTIAGALAGRDKTRLQPAGVYAANMLGLSEQVLAKAVSPTDGPSRTIRIDTVNARQMTTTEKGHGREETRTSAPPIKTSARDSHFATLLGAAPALRAKKYYVALACRKHTSQSPAYVLKY